MNVFVDVDTAESLKEVDLKNIEKVKGVLRKIENL